MGEGGLAVAVSPGEWLRLRQCVETLQPQQLCVSQYLELKERIAGALPSA